MRIAGLLTAIFVIGLTTGCQTTRQPYTSGMQTTLPASSNYNTHNEYLARLVVYSVPRKCVIKLAYSSDRPLADNFQIKSIIRIGIPDHRNWYGAKVSQLYSDPKYPKAAKRYVFGTLFFNADNPKEAYCRKNSTTVFDTTTADIDWKPGETVLTLEDIQSLIFKEG